jgi:hypothetical protein
MFQISDIATNLQLHEDGIWYSSAQHPVSYPDDGNRKFYAVEEESFWFLHRNNCIIDVMHNYPPGGPILDIGGGNGFISLALEKSGLEPILLEPGHDGVINARARGLPVILCSTLTDAGFREASVTAAGMFDVVEHVQDIKQRHGRFVSHAESCRQRKAKKHDCVGNQTGNPVPDELAMHCICRVTDPAGSHCTRSCFAAKVISL